MKPIHRVPSLAVTVDGKPLAAAAAASLHSARVRASLSEPSRCDLVFVDPPEALFAVGIGTGTALEVWVEGQALPLFAGEATVVERAYGPTRARELHVRGHDRLQRLASRQGVRAHIQVTVRDLADELLAEEGIVTSAPETGPLWRHLLQEWPDDLALLQGVAARAGLFFTLRGVVLHLCTLEGFGEPVDLVLGESLLDARIRLDSTRALQAVRAFGADLHEGVARRASVGSARSGRDALAAADTGGAGLRTLIDVPAPGAGHVEGVAQAELDRAAADEAVFTGVALGDTRLLPGTRVRVEGLAVEDCGQYVLTAVEHVVDGEKGYLSLLSTAAPLPPPEPARPALVTGEVSAVDDPEGRGRVRVTFPGLGGVESDWFQVLALGGATGRGLMVVPDVGDRVAVLLGGGHLAGGVVLGGLYGEAGVPDPGVSGGRVRRWTLRTGVGQLLRLDDEARTVRLEDASGSYFELGPEGVKLYAAAPLTLEAPGQAVVVAGATVDFWRR